MPAIFFFFATGFCCAWLAYYELGRNVVSLEVRNFVVGVVSVKVFLIFCAIANCFFATAFAIRLLEEKPAVGTTSISSRLLRVGLGGVSSFNFPAAGFFLGLAIFQAAMLIYLSGECALEHVQAGFLRAVAASTGLCVMHAVFVAFRCTNSRNKGLCSLLLLAQMLLFSFNVMDLMDDFPHDFFFVDQGPVVRKLLVESPKCQKYEMWRL